MISSNLHEYLSRNTQILISLISCGQGQSTPPSGAYSSVSAGKFFTCALGTKRAMMTCWGDNTYGQREPPLYDTCDNSECRVLRMSDCTERACAGGPKRLDCNHAHQVLAVLPLLG